MIFRRDNNIGTINTKTKKIHTLADRKGCLFSKVQVGIETFVVYALFLILLLFF